MKAATLRVESMFATAEHRAFKGDNSFEVLDYHGRLKRVETTEASLNLFVQHASSFTISEYPVQINAPLRLIDCWEDDPIGSGGPRIVETSEQLSPQQKQELKALFHPFSNVIYSEDINRHYSKGEIKKLFQAGNKNPLFQAEFQKRKKRSSAIGEDFKRAHSNEVIWTHLTLKFRQWALKNNFDSFVYENTQEVKGEDSFVSLKKMQIERATTIHQFNEEKYRQIVYPSFLSFLQQRHQLSKIQPNQTNKMYDTFWAGHDPLSFWNPTTTLEL